jgi:hypothetical protein
MGFRYIEGKSTITFYELKKTENGKYDSTDSKNTNNLNKYIFAAEFERRHTIAKNIELIIIAR